jgi:hypothetical protein
MKYRNRTTVCLLLGIALTIGAIKAVNSGESEAGDDPANSSARQVREPPTGVLPDPDPEDKGPAEPSRILHDSGITESSFAQFQDGATVLGAPPERALMLRLLLRLRMIPLLNIERWAKPIEDLGDVSDAPGRFRGSTLHVEGRVVAVKTIDLQEDESLLYELDRFHECHLLVGNPERPAVVYAREVPNAWKAEEVLDERASFDGIFLKRGPGPRQAAPVVFVTRRVAWHHGSLILGEMGMDHGLFDFVRHDRPLQPEENEGFYQLLGAMDNTRTRELIKFAQFSLNDQRRKWLVEQKALLEREKELEDAAEKSDAEQVALDQVKRDAVLLELNLKNLTEHRTHSFIPLLSEPAEHIGKLRMYRGTALAITPVIIDNAELKERLGFSRYFQINVMVRLECDLTLTKKREGTEVEESETIFSHPATLCVRKLPEGMPVGDSIHENIRFAGFFFKKWGYPIEGFDEKGRRKMRSAPMLIGTEPIWDTGPPPAYSTYAGAIAGGLFVLAVTVIWIGVWRIGRGDKQFQKSVISKEYDLEDGVSLNDLRLDVTSVDFSNLGKEQSESAESEPKGSQTLQHQTPADETSNSADQGSSVGRR